MKIIFKFKTVVLTYISGDGFTFLTSSPPMITEKESFNSAYEGIIITTYYMKF